MYTPPLPLPLWSCQPSGGLTRSSGSGTALASTFPGPNAIMKISLTISKNCVDSSELGSSESFSDSSIYNWEKKSYSTKIKLYRENNWQFTWLSSTYRYLMTQLLIWSGKMTNNYFMDMKMNTLHKQLPWNILWIMSLVDILSSDL